MSQQNCCCCVEWVVEITTPGDGTITVPSTACFSQIMVRTRGAGGGGGAASEDAAGGGGANAMRVIDVSPGDVIAYHVGFGGAGGIGFSAGSPGEKTWFLSSSLVGDGCVADGGDGGNDASSAGGSAAESLGDIVYEGARGGVGVTTDDGFQGGTSAGDAADGTQGSDTATTATNTGPAGSGTGGGGGLPGQNGQDGGFPGGGGGEAGIGGDHGGTGGNGRIIIQSL